MKDLLKTIIDDKKSNDFFIVERRKGNAITEDANCFLSNSMETVRHWINNNKDFDNRDYNWWWVVIKIELNDKFGGEIFKIFDWDGNELNEQPIEQPILLSEDFLIKFGFIKEEKRPSENHSQYYSMCIMDYKYSFAYAEFRKDWGFYHSYTDAPNEEENDRYDFISCGIKYVHEFKNLFSSLTINRYV